MGSARPWRGTGGTVTAEFAVILPAVLMLLAVVMALAAFGMKAIELQHGAQTVARELGRGTGLTDALAIGGQATAGSRAAVSRGGNVVCVSLRASYGVTKLMTLPLTVRSCAPMQGL